MRSPNKLVLSKRAVDALPVAQREAVFWDRDLSGFGVRVHPTGSKVYMVHTRAQGKSRRVSIGRHGVCEELAELILRWERRNRHLTGPADMAITFFVHDNLCSCPEAEPFPRRHMSTTRAIQGEASVLFN